MAHLNWHGQIVAVYQHNTKPNVRLHITDTGRVLRTTGIRNGKAKVLRIDTKSMKDGHPILSTLQGTFAHCDDLLVTKYIAANFYLL